MYFLRADAAFSRYQLMVSRCENGRWSRPEPPSFARRPPVNEADPFVTPDGNRIYYISTSGDPTHEDFDIWHVDRMANGAWGTAQRLPEPVNSKTPELLPRMDASGLMYFGSAREGGLGQGDIYTARLRAGRWEVRNIGAPVNTPAFEYEAEISRDGRTLIVVANRFERSHLYRYRLGDEGWLAMGEIDAKREHFQVGPLLSPNADRVLFAQRDEPRSGEIFLLDLVPKPDPSWPPECH
jgi:hypothetical protein